MDNLPDNYLRFLHARSYSFHSMLSRNFYQQSGQVASSFIRLHLPLHTPLKQLRHGSASGQSTSVLLVHSGPQHPSFKPQSFHILLHKAEHVPPEKQVSTVHSFMSSQPNSSVQAAALHTPPQQIPPVHAVSSAFVFSQ